MVDDDDDDDDDDDGFMVLVAAALLLWGKDAMVFTIVISGIDFPSENMNEA